MRKMFRVPESRLHMFTERLHKTTRCNIAVHILEMQMCVKRTGWNMAVVQTFNEKEHEAAGCNIAVLHTRYANIPKMTG